jgi:gamma-glutamylcyclotransferase (GGCT)/AIG2-like uncharacterized protein YtfP
MHNMAVYGTLQTGERNHEWLRELIDKHHAELVYEVCYAKGMGIVDIGGLPALYNVPFGDNPGLAENQDVGIRAKMQLYKISSTGVQCLDVLEGHPNFYRRGSVRITIPKIRNYTTALVYMGPEVRVDIGADPVFLGHLMHTSYRRNIVSEYPLEGGKRTPIWMTRKGLRIKNNEN